MQFAMKSSRPETPKRVLHALAAGSCFVAVLALGRQCSAGEDGKPAELVIEGMCKVSAPGEKFAWTKVREVKISGLTGRFFNCTTDPPTRRVVTLGAMEEHMWGDGRRLKSLREHWNGLVSVLKEQGTEVMEASPPSLKRPVPTSATYGLTAKAADGTILFYRSASIFHRNTYLLHAVSDSAADAEQLLKKVVGSLKEQEDPDELPSELGARYVAALAKEDLAVTRKCWMELKDLEAHLKSGAATGKPSERELREIHTHVSDVREALPDATRRLITALTTHGVDVRSLKHDATDAKIEKRKGWKRIKTVRVLALDKNATLVILDLHDGVCLNGKWYFTEISLGDITIRKKGGKEQLVPLSEPDERPSPSPP